MPESSPRPRRASSRAQFVSDTKWLTLKEVAYLLDIPYTTLHSQKQRGSLPPADAPHARGSLWRFESIAKWALESRGVDLTALSVRDNVSPESEPTGYTGGGDVQNNHSFGAAGLARLLNYISKDGKPATGTIGVMRRNGRVPDPDLTDWYNGSGVWYPSTIASWLDENPNFLERVTDGDFLEFMSVVRTKM